MPYHLCIDIGNSRVKAAIIATQTSQIVSLHRTNDADLAWLSMALEQYKISGIALASVRLPDKELEFFLTNYPAVVMPFSHQTPLPIANAYLTPHTLGLDRLAAITGAYYLHPKQHVLKIEAGTCLTLDFLQANGTYLGGSIAPGLHLRLQALHQFTQRLPLVSLSDETDFTGNTTETSINRGVLWGMVAEINGLIDLYSQKWQPLTVVLTGGDAALLANKLKNPIFATPNLVLYGLHKILAFNHPESI